MNASEQTTPSVPLVFSCSGAADVGEIADHAARSLHQQGAGKMFCLAGVGGLVRDILDRTKSAPGLLVIDGCEQDCGKQCLTRAGFTSFRHVRLTDLGMEKGKTPPNQENADRVLTIAARVLATIKC